LIAEYRVQSELNIIIECLKYVHSKKCWVGSTQIWVKYGQTQMLGKIK